MFPQRCVQAGIGTFRVGRHIVIEHLEDIQETDPLQYENLKRQNIHSLVVVPLYDGNKIIGFYGVDNPPVKSIEYATNMLPDGGIFYCVLPETAQSVP